MEQSEQVNSGELTNATQYLGIDLSTQQLKAIVVNDELEVIHECFVQFDNDLPEFRTHGGFNQDKKRPDEITAPTLMWVKALDMLFDRLTISGVDFSKILAVSGAGQQHGSVYWQNGSREILQTLNPEKFLHEQLIQAFSIADSPIWMDGSTTEQCKLLEQTVGGPLKLAEITGSRAYERFTGNQIAKIYQQKPSQYDATERISLVSNFLCSIFLGKYAPIDYSDGSGMNLLDINTRKWHDDLLKIAGGDQLREKLGEPVDSHSVVGYISKYYVERYGFNEDCQVVAFTGDNPASLIGLRLQENWLAVSLGTSDTVFLWLNEPKTLLDGHILINPLDSNAFFAMFTFKNGSLTRERIRDTYAAGSWDIFNQLLDNTPRGNFGNIGLYYTITEINQPLKGDFRFNKSNEPVSTFANVELEIRALIEGQFLGRRAYVEDMGYEFGAETKILATGGASVNKNILQVLSDVFNAPVYTLNVGNSAALGAAYQSKYAMTRHKFRFAEITAALEEPNLICKPFKDAGDIYAPMVERYRELSKMLTEKSP